jgi:hypothetical protein
MQRCRITRWPQGPYLIVAAGQRLYAPTLNKVAEIAQCATCAGDRIESLRVRAARGWRPLSDDEPCRLLWLLAASRR